MEMDKKTLIFLTDLPSEMIINILTRLPIKTIINCKYVCKSWYDLLKTPEFITSHLSKSIPSVIIYKQSSGISSQSLETYEFKDKQSGLENHESHYYPALKWDFKHAIPCMEGSADGLLCWRNLGCGVQLDTLNICNPITRECIQLPNPEGIVQYPSIVTYGFGVSKMSGEYKVVRIFHECEREQNTQSLLRIPKSECQVYTLGSTGSWRRTTGPGFEHEYNCRSNGAFLNGKLHWIVTDLKGSNLISCFDLETELFTVFSLPVDLPAGRTRYLYSLSVLGDCLCFCDNSSDDEIVIWTMREYGVEKSWKKEFTISKIPDFCGECYEVVYPLKVFEDGDILLAWDDYFLFYYSGKTKTIQQVDMFQLQAPGGIEARLHVSSFVSLKSFRMENVSSF